jgi:hypothetical protein
MGSQLELRVSQPYFFGLSMENIYGKSSMLVENINGTFD